ncbi:recombination-associated protein RdgC [Comamonadaceae bacterium PP-2]
MLKNLIIYRIGAAWAPNLEAICEKLATAEFAECSPTQEKSIGWVPPRGDAHGPMVEAIGGQWILKLMIESKAVPASVIDHKVKEKAVAIEEATGRKPGRKATKDLKEEAKQELLPHAFPRQGAVLVWIDPTARMLFVDASSQGKADDVVTALIEQVEGLTLTLLQTQQSAASAMSGWLVSQEAPAEFTIDRETELKATDESKAVVRYGKHPLDIDEVRGHIEAGKVPTKLAMTWNDRVSFVFTENLQLKRIDFLEGVYDGAGSSKEDGFDADVAIATGELAQLVPALVAALGGELELA